MICADNQKRMADEQFYMQQALQEARKAAEAGEVPVGAVVVCRDRIIARAHNLTETLNDVTAHAEMQAITAAANALGGKYLTDCTLYVTVEPCVMCAGAIAWSQMGKLVSVPWMRSGATVVMLLRHCILRQRSLQVSRPRNVHSS